MKKKLLTFFASVCVLCCVFGLIACGGNPTVAVTDVILDRSDLTLEIGGEETLNAAIKPEEATDKTVTWSVSPAGIVTVSGGKVTAIAAGSATVTATAGGKSASCAVTVNAPSVQGTYYTYWLSDNFWAYGDGEDIVLNDDNTCSLDGADGTYEVTDGVYNLAQEIYAKIDGNIMWLFNSREDAADIGNAIGFAYKGTEISAADKTKIETDSGVDFPPPIAAESVALGRTSLTLAIGDEKTLKATVLPENATNKSVTWSVSPAGTVTVVDGKVTAIAEGTATVTATTANGKTSACTVKVVVPTNELTFTEITDELGSVSYEVSKAAGAAYTNLVIPSHHNGKPVTKIADGAFGDCTTLQSVYIPETVRSIGAGAFRTCSELWNITIPDSVEKIGANAFKECKALLHIEIPDGIYVIETAVFDQSFEIITVVIPKTVTTISDFAFRNCLELKSVFYKGTAEDKRKINISSKSNTYLNSATWYYYSETEPAESGVYWHYAADGVTPVIW